MCARARYAHVVHDAWGFGRKIAPGRGVSALFAGESGTGKTMAAEVIANDLGLALYKIDLSAVVSKYIGETEKNLSAIFAEAQTSNAILFFDEADALFGKRSEVKDAHDRYANIEIAYLLQQIENYDGIAVLATNLRQNLDEAFTRRLDFLVDFPFPEVEYRARIWAVNFPPDAPLAPEVDLEELAARYRLAGGNIRNATLASAYLAAADGGAITMAHVRRAIRREHQKMGRLLDDDLEAGL
ncbi:MAG: ATP-binding protein [Anaerolineae bacterium]|nr:ATP-binding protein [Anaerolineae bacterium]